MRGMGRFIHHTHTKGCRIHAWDGNKECFRFGGQQRYRKCTVGATFGNERYISIRKHVGGDNSYIHTCSVVDEGVICRRCDGGRDVE